MNKPSDFIAKGWARGAEAMNQYNVDTDPESPDAVKWDIVGSVKAAYPNSKAVQDMVMAKITKTIANRPDGGFLKAYNDVHWMSLKLIYDILKEIGE